MKTAAQLKRRRLHHRLKHLESFFEKLEIAVHAGEGPGIIAEIKAQAMVWFRRHFHP